ncbi:MULTISPECIES: hypothetical protein [unclassified Microcoleus]|uniref:hypothetical protein n=1 Tax=unclassified Microcoleus TaxID=2642155 RepID=UPI002FD71BAC
MSKGGRSILDFRFWILDFGLNQEIAGDWTDPGNLVLDAETGFFYLNTAFEGLKMVENPVSMVLMGKSRSNSTIERTMNIEIERTAYGQLLAKSQPKPILNEEDYDLALAEVEYLMSQEELTLEEETLLSLWALLIEEYEAKYYPIPEATPQDVLLHLMEVRELKKADLVGVIGSKGVVSEVVNGKRAISKAQAKALGEFFNINPSVFI